MKSVLKAENVSKYYNAGTRHEVRAVDNISVEVGENEKVLLYGPSGSGKTTLLGLIGTLDRPTSGRIFLLGQDVTRFSEGELSRIRRKTVGFVFQSFNLLSGLCAWENVSYPLIPMGIAARVRFDRARVLLERLGLGDRIHHPPEELSGGEQQRVAIARALINNPDVVIADEPTSNIDADSVAAVFDIFENLTREGKTVVISSHDPSFKRWADVWFHLNRGRLQARSPAAENEEEG